MPPRFLKIDLTYGKSDFEHFVMDHGAPLLDRDGANRRFVRTWLGRFAGEPEWKDLDQPLSDDEVAFFACTPDGRLMTEISCDPVTRDELKSNAELRRDFDELKSALKSISPKPGPESKLRDALQRNFNAALDAEGLPECEFHFFKYRQGKTWRLVWCWGYQRRDRKTPGSAVICTSSSCRQLFVKRQDGVRVCPNPRCKQPVSRTRTTSHGGRGRLWAALAVLALLLAGGGYSAWRWMPQPAEVVAPETAGELVVSPATWNGPAGGRLEFKVERRGEGGKLDDVTPHVVLVSENPKIARIEAGHGRVVARSHGKTAVHFYLGDLTAHATVAVDPPENPRSIRIEPAEVALGVGTTAPLRVWAEFADGPSLDVTERAEWEPLATTVLAGAAGRVEGVSVGEAVVSARYRATEGDPYRTAQARVRVAAEKYSRLEVRIEPAEIVEGNRGRIVAEVFDESGASRSVVQSSLLRFDLDAAGVAELDGEGLTVLGRQAGAGRLRATFGATLQAEATFQVTNDLSGRFAVAPRDLRMMVGEICELQVTSASSEPVRIASSAKTIVEVLDGTRVAARGVGKAELTVVQEAREEKVQVEVTAPDLKEIAFVPPRVAVPLDRTVPLRLVGRTKDGQEYDLAPDAFVWETVPPPAVAELDVRKLELRGRGLTGESPQEAVARLGEHRARVQIDVSRGPLQIELTPAGVVELPEGQTAPLHAWARYGDGARREIDAARLEWHVTPADVRGVRFDASTGTARGVKAGDVLTISANYQGYESNRVDVRCTYQELPLTVHGDRALIAAGDRGRFRATVAGAPSEFALTGVRFESSDAAILAVEPTTGEYRALAAGRATISAQHPNAKAPGSATFEVAQEATLAIRPEKLELLVGGRLPLELFLVAPGREERVPLSDPLRSPRVSLARPDAARWRAPFLAGLQESEPFEIVVEYEGKTARALVEVAPGGGPIRVAPDQVRLSPGQAHSPQVEQQSSVSHRWQEIEPSLLTWQVPDGLRWTPARGDLRPQLTPADTAEGSLTVEAKYGDQQARLTVEVSGSAAPKGPLEVVREPAGESLEVDSLQRFSIVVRQGDRVAPAAGIRWEPAFENDYVRWAPPVLYAKRAGHEQVLSATVGEERITFQARTVAENSGTGEPPLPDEPPAEVRLTTAAPQPVALPVRARFGEFRVEAIFPGRPSVDVTREALLEVNASGEPPAPLAVADGQVVAQHAGAAELRASYRGVAAKTGVRFEVVDDAKLTELAFDPPRVRIQVGESATIRVEGFATDAGARRSLGEVSGLPGLTWSSEPAGIVSGDGPRLTGLKPGRATLFVRGGGASAQGDVEVVAAGDVAGESLIVTPQLLRLKTGESKRLGRDVQVRRGGVDLTDHCDATSADPLVARFDAPTRSVVGVTAGSTLLTVAGRGASAVVRVEVEGAVASEGRVVLEPNGGVLGVGESLDLRVFVVGESGERTDRTGVAYDQRSSDPQVLGVARGRLTGLSPGSARVSVSVPGIAQPGEATFRVEDAEFTELIVSPTPLRLAIGERRALEVEGVGPKGRRKLGDHPDLRTTVGGPDPRAIEIGGAREVRGVAPGSAEIAVRWRGLAARPVPVEVTYVPVTGLRIEPPTIDVAAGGRGAFRVLITQGAQERAATTDDDVRLSIGDPSIATAAADFSVRGVAPGATSVVAQLGSRRAQAQVRVAPSGQDPARAMPPGLRFIPDVLTMQLGVPGGPFRLVRILPGGVVEDKRSKAEYEVFPDTAKSVVTVKDTGTEGPVFVATQVGRAQVRARVDGETTPQPLVIDVVDPNQPRPGQGPAQLEVHPDPLRLAAGAVASFRRVQIAPTAGAPFDVDYEVTSENEQIVVIEDGRRLKGLRAGQTQVVVAPRGVAANWADLKTNVTVIVESAEAANDAQERLVLSGPSRGAVGAPATYRVELTSDGRSREVTNDGAALVIDRVDEAAVQSGCVLTPNVPTTLRVRARYKHLVSNDLTLTVDPPLSEGDVERLVIEIEPAPLKIGERRSYVIWGYPVGPGARRDLTRQIVGADKGEAAAGAVQVSPEEAGSVVGHSPPELIGKAPGAFRLVATYGALRSPEVALRVVGDDDRSPPRLEARPSTITLRVGQKTPDLQALATDGERPRVVDAVWTSADPNILAPVAGESQRFVGKTIGRTRLKGTFQEKASVEVTVVVTGDPFEDVKLESTTTPEKDNRFSVTAVIQATNTAEEGLEYRIVPAGQAESEVAWKAAPIGPQQTFSLASPPIRRGDTRAVYRLDVQARDQRKRIVAVYPLTFTFDERIKPTTGKPAP